MEAVSCGPIVLPPYRPISELIPGAGCSLELTENALACCGWPAAYTKTPDGKHRAARWA